MILLAHGKKNVLAHIVDTLAGQKRFHFSGGCLVCQAIVEIERKFGSHGTFEVKEPIEERRHRGALQEGRAKRTLLALQQKSIGKALKNY